MDIMTDSEDLGKDGRVVSGGLCRFDYGFSWNVEEGKRHHIF